jgi:hypothetical protein
VSSSCTRAHRTPIEDLLLDPSSEACREFLQHCEGCDNCAAELARQRRRSAARRAPPRTAIVLVLCLALLAGIAWLWAGGRQQPADATRLARTQAEQPAPPDAGRGAAIAPSEELGAPPGELSSPRAPALRIAESGRISIDAASLPDGEVLALGLALADEARGSEPLSVRVVSIDGRRIETTAVPAAGSGSGLRLELETEWLRPGRYMIEVTTAEKIPLHLRRYVIEIGEAAPAL